MSNGRLMHQIFIGVVEEPAETNGFVYENGDGILFENGDTLIDQQ